MNDARRNLSGDLTADRVALRYLVEAYATGCDTRDEALLTTCFADGATLTVHWLDRDSTTMHMPKHIGNIPKGLSRYDRTLHFVGNHTAHIDGDRATGVTYCFAHHITGTNDYIMAIRYHDVYQREATGWRFAERQLHLDWTQNTTIDARP